MPKPDMSIDITPAASSVGPVESGKSLTFWLALAAVLIVLDQVTKIYFELNFDYQERLNVLPFFDFILVYNTGAAFSFLADAGGWQHWFFIGLAFAAVIFIIFQLRSHKQDSFFCFSLCLIMAGAIGNVIDRIAYGHVIDFLLFYWNNWYFPAFNLADCFITVGATLVVVQELFMRKKDKP